MSQTSFIVDRIQDFILLNGLNDLSIMHVVNGWTSDVYEASLTCGKKDSFFTISHKLNLKKNNMFQSIILKIQAKRKSN